MDTWAIKLVHNSYFISQARLRSGSAETSSVFQSGELCGWRRNTDTGSLAGRVCFFFFCLRTTKDPSRCTVAAVWNANLCTPLASARQGSDIRFGESMSYMPATTFCRSKIVQPFLARLIVYPDLWFSNKNEPRHGLQGNVNWLMLCQINHTDNNNNNNNVNF